MPPLLSSLPSRHSSTVLARALQTPAKTGDCPLSSQRRQHQTPKGVVRHRLYGVLQRLYELVPLEVLVADALLVALDARDGEDAVPLPQPARVQLAVQDEPVRRRRPGRR